MPTLFDPIRIGALDLASRIVMAPLTRCRAGPGQVPTALMAEYYAQRADPASGAGLIVSEATQVCPEGQGYLDTPGLHSAAQVAGWRRVTGAVHARGARIVAQLWHVGRISHVSLQPGGRAPVSSSAKVAQVKTRTAAGREPVSSPRALVTEEIPGIVEQYRAAALRALDAGFDGVEVHAANGYLLDEFLRDGANKRTGPYGGPVANRARLLCEVVEAVCAVCGSDRVGVRLSPLNSYNSMIDSDPIGLATWLASRLNDFDLAYLHLMRGDFFRQQGGDVLTPVRASYRGTLIGNMGYSADEADAAIAAGQLDAVAFGTAFLANPDLPERIRMGAPLNTPDPATFYTPGPAGYTDYPPCEAR